jgi:hypothetical protein
MASPAHPRAGAKHVLRVRPMSSDGSHLLGEGEIVFNDPARHPKLEGPKFLKKDNWYYILAPPVCWPAIRLIQPASACNGSGDFVATAIDLSCQNHGASALCGYRIIPAFTTSYGFRVRKNFCAPVKSLVYGEVAVTVVHGPSTFVDSTRVP